MKHYFREPGDLVYLLGETKDELGASEYLKAIHNRIDGQPPALDVDVEAALHRFMREATSRRLLRSAHDLSDGGLGVAIAESLFGPLGETMGASIALEVERRADGVLFSESQSRILTSVPSESVDALSELAAEHGVPFSRIGVTGGNRLDIHVNGVKAISKEVAALRQTWWTAIERGLAP